MEASSLNAGPWLQISCCLLGAYVPVWNSISGWPIRAWPLPPCRHSCIALNQPESTLQLEIFCCETAHDAVVSVVYEVQGGLVNGWRVTGNRWSWEDGRGRDGVLRGRGDGQRAWETVMSLRLLGLKKKVWWEKSPELFNWRLHYWVTQTSRDI